MACILFLVCLAECTIIYQVDTHLTRIAVEHKWIIVTWKYVAKLKMTMFTEDHGEREMLAK